MGLFGKKQTDDCEDLGEALAQTNSGRREVELVIGDDGELEAMTPDEAEKSGKEKVGTTIGPNIVIIGQLFYQRRYAALDSPR